MLPSIAAKLRTVAELLIELADALLEANPDTPSMNGAYRAALYAALEVVAYWISRGAPELTAFHSATRAHPLIDHATIAKAWPLYEKKRHAHQLHAKRLLVGMLTAKGMTNRQIAALVGVHEKHVPRMRAALTPTGARQTAASRPKKGA